MEGGVVCDCGLKAFNAERGTGCGHMRLDARAGLLLAGRWEPMEDEALVSMGAIE